MSDIISPTIRRLMRAREKFGEDIVALRNKIAGIDNAIQLGEEQEKEDAAPKVRLSS